MLEVQKGTLEMAGHSRLDQIRHSMAGNQLSAPPSTSTPPLSSGTKSTPVAEGDVDRA